MRGDNDLYWSSTVHPDLVPPGPLSCPWCAQKDRQIEVLNAQLIALAERVTAQTELLAKKAEDKREDAFERWPEWKKEVAAKAFGVDPRVMISTSEANRLPQR